MPAPAPASISVFTLTSCPTEMRNVEPSTTEYYTNGSVEGIIVAAYTDSSPADSGPYVRSTGEFKSDAVLQSYITSRVGNSYLKARPTTNLTDLTTASSATVSANVDTMAIQDAEMLTEMNNEYCFYYKRYEKALDLFMKATTGANGISQSDAPRYLTLTIEFNNRLNAFAKIIDEYAKQRVTALNGVSAFIRRVNNELDTNRQQIQDQSKFLNSSNAIIRTRKEMVNFTEQKNNHITNQISLWAALNILAIASILTVYRSMK